MQNSESESLQKNIKPIQKNVALDPNYHDALAQIAVIKKIKHKKLIQDYIENDDLVKTGRVIIEK